VYDVFFDDRCNHIEIQNRKNKFINILETDKFYLQNLEFKENYFHLTLGIQKIDKS